VRDRRDWPSRFRVIVRNAHGVASTYHAITWLSRDKAVALAVDAHLQRHPEAGAVYEIEAEDLGPAPRQPDGTAAPEPADLVDRLEW
jgi:hypothetical protein